MYETGRHSFLRSANSVLECRRRCLSSESCNLYLFFSMGSLSRADWKQQLDSAGESHQPPNGRFEQRKAKAKRSRKVEWTGKTYTCTFCGCISGHVYLLRLVAGGCFMHFICWRQAATFWSTVVQWIRMWALNSFNTFWYRFVGAFATRLKGIDCSDCSFSKDLKQHETTLTVWDYASVVAIETSLSYDVSVLIQQTGFSIQDIQVPTRPIVLLFFWGCRFHRFPNQTNSRRRHGLFDRFCLNLLEFVLLCLLTPFILNYSIDFDRLLSGAPAFSTLWDWALRLYDQEYADMTWYELISGLLCF